MDTFKAAVRIRAARGTRPLIDRNVRSWKHQRATRLQAIALKRAPFNPIRGF